MFCVVKSEIILRSLLDLKRLLVSRFILHGAWSLLLKWFNTKKKEGLLCIK